MDQKSEKPPTRVTKDQVVKGIVEGMIRRAEEQREANRKYALGGRDPNASNEQTRQEPQDRVDIAEIDTTELPGTVPSIPQEPPKGY